MALAERAQRQSRQTETEAVRQNIGGRFSCCGRPHGARIRGHGSDERDFWRYGERDGACGGQSVKVMRFTGLLKSLTYITVRCCGPPLGGGSGPLGTRASSRSQGICAYGILRNAGNKEMCAVFVSLRPRLLGMVGRPQVGRIGVEVEGVMRLARGG